MGKIYAQEEKVHNQASYFKKTVKYVGEPMTHLESIASSTVHSTIKVKASVKLFSHHLDMLHDG